MTANPTDPVVAFGRRAMAGLLGRSATDPTLAAIDAAEEALADQLDDDRYGPADAPSTTLCGWEACDSPPAFAVDGKPACANHLHLVTAVALYAGAERPVSVRCWP